MTANGWWERRGFIALALFLSIIPLLWPAIPPLSDLPGHMASYAVSVASEDSPLRQYFSFNWKVIGNLGVDALMVPTGHLLGVEAGTKLVVILIPLLTVGGMLLVAREAHGRLPATAAFALPLAYHYFFFFGFVNFCLAMALALVAFALWLRLGRMDRPWLRAALFVVIALTVWAAHAIGWALMAIMCGSSELYLQWSRKRPVSALAATAIACLPLLAALVPMVLQPAGEPASMYGWLVPKELAKWPLALFRDRWIWFDILCAATVGGVLAVAATGRLGLRLSPVLTAAGGALLVAYVLVPRGLNGADFINQRILPYAIAMLLLAIDTPRATPRLTAYWAAAAATFLVVRTIALTASAAAYDREWREQLTALNHVAPGSAVATFASWPCVQGLGNWRTPRTNHLSGIATVRRAAFVNSLWTLDGIQLLRSRYAAAGGYQSDPSQFVTVDACTYSAMPLFERALAGLPMHAFDYLWLVDVPRGRWPRDARLQPIWSAGNSVLYRINASAK